MINVKKPSIELVFILLVRSLGLFLGFVPFYPNTLYYLGLAQAKIPINADEYIFIIFGFIMVWGSKNFGTWAGALGRKIKDKI